MPYDYLALAPVIEEAGGVITDWRGRALSPRSDGRVLAAANADLHRQALEILAAGA
jgi:fructose-1,6-bisphosphatase/inositol monophosphatase family enzyme